MVASRRPLGRCRGSAILAFLLLLLAARLAWRQQGSAFELGAAGRERMVVRRISFVRHRHTHRQ